LGFRFLEHTADARALLDGDTFAELLRSAAAALYDLSLTDAPRPGAMERRITLEADTREELLVRWLQELVFLLESEHFAASRIDFTTANANHVEAGLAGDKVRPESRDQEVKGATYHQVQVEETPGGFEARVTFDL
jgi:SHS2 domain-containing protein